MVEELKLAIKIDDASIEQSLLKQFANAQKMADKVVLDFKNVNFDDKQIEAKFKEMQKKAGQNPIDLTIGGNTLDMLGQIDKRLTEIFSIGKGKSFIDSSSIAADVNRITQSTNQQIKAVEKVTSSYKNQAYELASILKMLAKFDQYGDAPYAENLSKVVKSSASSFKEGNSIQFAALKNGFTEEMLKYLRGFSVNLSGAFNYAENLGLDSATISDVGVLVKYFRELLKEKVAFNNAKLNMSDIEELIKALGILKKEHIDDGTKSGRNVYGDAYLDKYSNLDMIKDYLKEQEKQAVATAQAEQKLADAEKEVGKSSIPESQNKIQEELKETQKQAEQTSESLSKIGDGNKSNISSASTESVTNSIKEENNVLEQNTQKIKENTQAKEQNANVNLNKYDKRLDSYNGKIDKYKTTIDRFNDGGWTSGAYLENVQAVKNAVHEYETLLNELKGKDASLVTSDDISKLDEYEKKIKDTIATVTNMSASEKGYNFVSGQKELDKIHKLLNENSKMSSEAKAKIKAYYKEIESGNPSMSLDKIHGEILKIYNAEVEAGRAGRTLFDTLKNSGFHQIAAQMAGMFGVYDAINLGKEGFNVVRELNTALTEMRKVSDETVQSLKDYQATTFDTADAVGTTAKQIQNSTADWMRLGESMNQAAESAKDANVLLNVSEFEGIDEATESLVSMSQAYKDLDKMDIIDVLNNIGNNYSISTDGLATALKDSASALVTANNDLNEAVSLTTAGNAITQDPSKVGAGLRTISLRLVGTEEAKQELSDLGEETDGMITTVSKLRDTIMDATKAASSDGKGFDILDSNGNYKSTYEIMQGLADLYDDIVKKDKELGTNNLNLLLETIAGKNRSNIAASILQNGDMLRSVYEDAQNSEGSAQKELNSYLDSIDGKMAQLENRAQEFWFKVIDSETIKNGINLLSTLLKGATNFVDTVGLLPTILAPVVAILGKGKSIQRFCPIW